MRLVDDDGKGNELIRAVEYFHLPSRMIAVKVHLPNPNPVLIEKINPSHYDHRLV
jgi:hypothetical protein